ncbi:hypothetical protein BS47DRAFT_1288133 [Hydnum rufescens UP504]|uniref:Transcription factor domain-containing protein n=1 Tax=Hydnum rufescens UP504 TaxID=1448309 RepID=A0A9P6DYQ5_9AGAM|nr:hypothetical protein BS47DRAFT_1288133 [Hydnum rufescens UP504]
MRLTNISLPSINVPLFFSTFHHPSQREYVQPSLVLAMLALSILLQSSDMGLGQRGRLKALELRDLAQCYFDLSLNSGWITADLAQAALLLVVFEACCHPAHSESRARSALFLLDSLILGLGFLDLDKDYNATTFRPNSVPSLGVPFSDHIGQAAIGPGATQRGCSCSYFQLSTTSPSSRRITPLWATCPGWNDDWDVIETRREEQRELVWTALYLTSGFLSHYSSFKVFFPAERLFGTPQMQVDLAAKHSIWALQARCHMLYTSCLSVHHDESISEYDKGQFAVQAWLETEQIKQMLDSHTCDIERANLYFGRQILFDTQNLVSSQYTRYIPHPSIGDPHFHRDKAELWLRHQKNVMQGFVAALSRVTGLKENSLATRPYFTFWFHDQLAR